MCRAGTSREVDGTTGAARADTRERIVGVAIIAGPRGPPGIDRAQQIATLSRGDERQPAFLFKRTTSAAGATAEPNKGVLIKSADEDLGHGHLRYQK